MTVKTATVQLTLTEAQFAAVMEMSAARKDFLSTGIHRPEQCAEVHRKAEAASRRFTHAAANPDFLLARGMAVAALEVAIDEGAFRSEHLKDAAA